MSITLFWTTQRRWFRSLRTGYFLPGDVVLGIFTVIGQSSKQVAATANQREAVSEAGAGGRAVLWSLGLQAFPLPATRLKETTGSELQPSDSHTGSPSADCSGVSAGKLRQTL